MKEWRRRRAKSTKYKYGLTHWRHKAVLVQSYAPDEYGYPLNVVWWKDVKGRVRFTLVEDVMVDDRTQPGSIGLMDKSWTTSDGRSHHAYDALIPRKQEKT